MSLEDELARRRKAVAERLPAAERRVIDDSIDGLRMLQLAETALDVGDTLPEFALPDQEERMVRSEDLLSRGPLVLAFFRGGWCPYCDVALRGMEVARPRIVALGATLIGVLPEKPEQLRRTAAERELHYPLLCDVDGRFGRLCGVNYVVREEHVQFYLRHDIDLAARHGGAAWSLPLPASYVVDGTGIVRFAFVNPDWSLRAEPEALIEAVRRLAQADSVARTC